jgi:hypothetical protein
MTIFPVLIQSSTASLQKPIIGSKVRAVTSLRRPKPFISFSENDRIEVVWRLNNWWCWGEIKGKIGLVPLNYTVGVTLITP